jgi:Domain of unknown function (DUF4333)
MLRSGAVPSGTSPRPTLALLLASLVAVSCTPSALDTAQLERRLGLELSDRLDRSGIVVDCPNDVVVDAGATFACVARARGETEGLRILVTQRNDDGDVTWEIAGAAG